jgi:hypothetical protein
VAITLLLLLVGENLVFQFGGADLLIPEGRDGAREIGATELVARSRETLELGHPAERLEALVDLGALEPRDALRAELLDVE